MKNSNDEEKRPYTIKLKYSDLEALFWNYHDSVEEDDYAYRDTEVVLFVRAV